MHTYSITYFYLLIHSLTQSLHGAQSFLEKLTNSELVEKSPPTPHFMEPKSSLPHWPAPATCPFPELSVYNYLLIQSLFPSV
jgi:hypothetical protein